MVALLNGSIGLHYTELERAGIPQKSMYRAIERGKLQTTETRTGKRLILFDGLKEVWKDLVNQHFGGDVRQYVQFRELESVAICSELDKNTLYRYRTVAGLALDAKRREMYQDCCGLLALLARLHPVGDAQALAFGTANKKEFWQMVYAYIRHKGLKLPKSTRLMKNVRNYMEQGATAVISKKLGWSNRQKLHQKQIDTIIALYCDPQGRKFNKRQVWEQFIMIAKEQGWNNCLDITRQQVGNILNENMGEWVADRHGEGHFKQNRALVINRFRATRPNLVWQLDGTPEHVWYYDGKTIRKLYVMKVMDAHSWKIVGYSLGKVENSTLVFEATKMGCVMHQVKPKEFRTDKGSAMQAGETKALFESLGANYFPTATGNARAKTIEAWQRHFNEQVLTYFANKSGGNITAKSLNSKQNPDKLKRFYKSYPNKEELIKQIRLAMHLWNETPNGKGKTPNQIYHYGRKSGGNALNLLEQFELFSIWRKKGETYRQYQFTYQGLSMEVSGRTYRYLPALEATELAAFMNQHADVTRFFVKYDPSDLTQIALYVLPTGAEETSENMRFVCEAVLKGQTHETPLDATEESQRLLDKYRKTQKEQLHQVKESQAARRERLEAENVLGGAITIERLHKDRYNAAQEQYQREELLGFNQELSDDRNAELSARSLEADDIIKYKENVPPPKEQKDIYG